MFYTDLQKNEFLTLFERILTEQEVERIREEIQDLTLEDLVELPKKTLNVLSPQD